MSGIPLEEFVELVDHGLDRGMTTDEVASEVGIKYMSVIRRLSKNNISETHRRITALRAKEWDDLRPSFVYNNERPRCLHGAWSASGDCEHGAMGRYAKEQRV